MSSSQSSIFITSPVRHAARCRSPRASQSLMLHPTHHAVVTGGARHLMARTAARAGGPGGLLQCPGQSARLASAVSWPRALHWPALPGHRTRRPHQAGRQEAGPPPSRAEQSSGRRAGRTSHSNAARRKPLAARERRSSRGRRRSACTRRSACRPVVSTGERSTDDHRISGRQPTERSTSGLGMARS
jgi:hypothetical protein